MDRPLLVVDPSVGWPETQGVAEVVRAWDGPAHVWTPVLDPATAPEDAGAYAAAVLLGSRASVHDRAPWLDALSAILGATFLGETPRPFLGVCFGHQWLAAALGAEVRFAREDHGKIVGVRTTRCDRSRLAPGRGDLRVVASHREVVTGAPPGFRVTATREDCAVDAFEHAERPWFGVQFHPEAREDFARSAGIAPAAIDGRVRDDGMAVLRGFAAIARRV